MKRHWIVVLAICGMLVLSSTASAQEKGQKGLAMGIPATIAFVWHPSDTFAIRPEVGFTRTSIDSEGGSGGAIDSSSWNFTVGVSGLFYFHKVETCTRTSVHGSLTTESHRS